MKEKTLKIIATASAAMVMIIGAVTILSQIPAAGFYTALNLLGLMRFLSLFGQPIVYILLGVCCLTKLWTKSLPAFRILAVAAALVQSAVLCATYIHLHLAMYLSAFLAEYLYPVLLAVICVLAVVNSRKRPIIRKGTALTFAIIPCAWELYCLLRKLFAFPFSLAYFINLVLTYVLLCAAIFPVTYVLLLPRPKKISTKN